MTTVASAKSSPWARWAPALVVVLTVASLALKLHGAFDHMLAGDELFERAGARDNRWIDFLQWSHTWSFYDTPPLSFAFYRLLVIVPGLDSELAWRLPGILAGVLCVPLVYFAARRMAGVGPGLFGAAWCAFDLNLNWNAQIARPYPLEIFFLLAGLAAATTERRGALVAGFLLFSAAMWTHMLAFVFIAGIAVALGIEWALRSRFRFAAINTLGWSAVTALVGYMPFFVLFRFVADTRIVSALPGVPADWPEAIARIRWSVGLLTWVHVPLANPALWTLLIGGLLWWSWRRGSSLAFAVVGGGCTVMLSLFYVVWHHEFIEPRYLLGASVMLWFGAAALGAELASLVHFRRALAVLALALTAAQAWRAWDNENFYGTIGYHRMAARNLRQALDYIAAHHPGRSVVALPDLFVLRESLQRLGVPLAPPAGAQGRPAVYLLAGESNISRRHGDPVGEFIDRTLQTAGWPEERRVQIRERCADATWTVWFESNGQPVLRHF